VTTTTTANKQQLIFNLMGTDPEALNTTIIYIVYKTIVANDKIKLYRLKTLLMREYMLSAQAIEGAVAGLISESGFNAIDRWLGKNKPVEETQLHTPKVTPASFQEWLDSTVSKYPELESFTPPIFFYKPEDKETKA
jgi:hypothetical protein